MIKCPRGYYCPPGNDEPIACPKGTWNGQEGRYMIDQCIACEAGTACDVTGIADQERKRCPVGYYCPEGSYSPQSCPRGTFRPNLGAKTAGPATYDPLAATLEPACFACVGRYYCQTKATVVPELCPVGYYCPTGTADPLLCEPGYYCDAGTKQ